MISGQLDIRKQKNELDFYFTTHTKINYYGSKT